MLPIVKSVLKSSPRVGLEVWRTFAAAETEGRIVLSLFALVLFGLFAWALVVVAAGVPSLLMLPWRVYSSQVLRTFGTPAVREQFSAKNFIARPPPFLKSLFVELQLAAVVNSIYMLVAIIVGIAFLFVGSSALIGGLGHYGGAGASLPWGGP
jgi:hypothetical protein